MTRVRIIGPGRAGQSFAAALTSAGWHVADIVGRADGPDAVAQAAQDVDLVLITTPDDAIAAVAQAIATGPAVIAHVAGSHGLGVLAPHPHRAAIHPLMALPTPEAGAARLVSGGWFGIAGTEATGLEIAQTVVDAFGGQAAVIADEHRARYHAAAAVAANHVVVVMAQVERLAAEVGMPMEAYLALTRGSLQDVESLGAVAALTGPASRGDEATVARHRAALASNELDLYNELAAEARRIAATRAGEQPEKDPA